MKRISLLIVSIVSLIFVLALPVKAAEIEQDYVYGNTAFTNYDRDILLNTHLLPLLQQGQYHDGFSVYLEQSSAFLMLARNDNTLDGDSDATVVEEASKGSFAAKLAITLVIPLLIAGIICLIMLGQMKSAIPQRTANAYIAAEGLNLTRKTDEFLYRDETRTPIEQKSSSGSASVNRDGLSGSKGKF